jgi:RimJ/RimL family protein N-acetyltransferase
MRRECSAAEWASHDSELSAELSIDIVPIAEEHADGFHAVLDLVARERKYLAMVEAPPLEKVREFIRRNVSRGALQWVAVDSARSVHNGVVGWCDILPDEREGFRHVGRLGMGVHPDYRGRGIGPRLVASALSAARPLGLERVDLEVFASNVAAIRLYERLGFVHEGVRRRVRKLDGYYEDNLFMSLLLDEPLSSTT